MCNTNSIQMLTHIYIWWAIYAAWRQLFPPMNMRKLANSDEKMLIHQGDCSKSQGYTGKYLLNDWGLQNITKPCWFNPNLKYTIHASTTWFILVSLVADPGFWPWPLPKSNALRRPLIEKVLSKQYYWWARVINIQATFLGQQPDYVY